MLCEKCQERNATVHYTEIVNGQKREMHLCEECAREEQVGSFSFSPQLNLHHFLAGLMGPETGRTFIPGNQLQCRACGLTEREFRRTGLLGCAECYEQFSSWLKPLLRRIHGTVRHTGKIPERTGGQSKQRRELQRLKQELQAAVSQERFEEAAKLRDRIRELEKQMEQGGE
ncbi:MAG: UvrB/UvrC motif-containing protein [Peptococcaceae bacterium]|nr:UvrB/UvrC motif-containing protein [Peptococcaceae bacterium]